MSSALARRLPLLFNIMPDYPCPIWGRNRNVVVAALITNRDRGGFCSLGLLSARIGAWNFRKKMTELRRLHSFGELALKLTLLLLFCLETMRAFFVFLSACPVSRSLSDNWHVCLWTPLTWEKEGWTEMRGWRMGQNARLIFIYNKLCNLFSWRELRLTNYHLLFSLHNIIKQQTKCC